MQGSNAPTKTKLLLLCADEQAKVPGSHAATSAAGATGFASQNSHPPTQRSASRQGHTQQQSPLPEQSSATGQSSASGQSSATQQKPAEGQSSARQVEVRWYDARARTALKKVALWTNVPWTKIATFECLAAEQAQVRL